MKIIREKLRLKMIGWAKLEKERDKYMRLVGKKEGEIEELKMELNRLSKKKTKSYETPSLEISDDVNSFSDAKCDSPSKEEMQVQTDTSSSSSDDDDDDDDDDDEEISIESINLSDGKSQEDVTKEKNKEVVPSDLSDDEETLAAFRIKKFKKAVHPKTKTAVQPKTKTSVPQVHSSQDGDDDFMDSPENWAIRNNKAKAAEAVLRRSPRVLSNKVVEEAPTLGDWVNNVREPQKNKVAEQTKAVDNVLKNITESVSTSEVVLEAMKKLKGSKAKRQVTPSSLVRNLGNRKRKLNVDSAYNYDLRKKNK